MFYKEIITDMNGYQELYVYHRGRLIFKRWLKHGYSKVFHGNELVEYRK